ncbi:MAG: ankyrin repeat domain-containing protein [Candidatus Sericytochromatia bacterium]
MNPLNQRLVEACRDQQWADVPLLLSQGADPNCTLYANGGPTPLLLSAERGHVPTLAHLLQAGADLHHEDEYHETAFVKAAGMNQLAAMAYLAEQGLAPEGTASHRLLALERVINLGQTEAFEWLLAYGLPVWQPSAQGRYPMVYAIEQRQFAMASRLLATPPGPEAASPGLRQSIVLAAVKSGNVAFCREVYPLWQPTAPSALASQVLLKGAAASNHPEMFQFLLDQGHDPTDQTLLQQDPDSLENALASACLDLKTDVAAHLLQQGAQPNVQDEDGYTPLMRAATEHETELCQLLLAHGASPHLQNHEGDTALHLAVSGHYGSNPELVQALLAAGADPLVPNSWDSTALSYVNDAETLGLLLAVLPPSVACQQALQSLLEEALELENEELMGVIPDLLKSRAWDG